MPGTGFAVAVRIGKVERVLVQVLRRYHYEIAAPSPGEVTGWRAPSDVSLVSAESNQASGTAIAIRAAWRTGRVFPHQLTVIRDILAECEGVVRWSGDDNRPCEALFSTDVPPGDPRLSALAARIRSWNERPDTGAGTHVETFSPRTDATPPIG
jgi:hypothetical protein